MEKTIKDLCAKHGLTGIAVNIFRADTKPYVTVYLHWQRGEGGCASGSGETFDEALALALAEMAERRTARAA
ncbi:hypothetical protein [Mesorhizobium amorphae]|uniref:hypothetical protein n=1 Tax=Mesorhizobium amorphae TaxID=71433 RepID=UPI001184B493|nr:hypothetical protein [Mesorhizobium amorphae]